ncbi:hypothetical protein FRC07_004555, partial [Ceratobasidium sp. 392]
NSSEPQTPFDVDPNDFEDDNFSPDIHFDGAYTLPSTSPTPSDSVISLSDTSSDLSDSTSSPNRSACPPILTTPSSVKRLSLIQTTLPFKSIPRDEFLAIESRRYHERKEKYEEALERDKLLELKKKVPWKVHDCLRKRAQRQRQKLARQAAGILSKSQSRQLQKPVAGLSMRHSVASLSRPHSNAYGATKSEPTKAHNYQKVAKRTPTHRVNWTTPLIWSQIEQAAVEVGYPWSPTKIV